MPPPPLPPDEAPYRHAFSGAVGSALFAAAIAGGTDVALTLSSADGVTGREAMRFATVSLSLYLAAALAVGLFQGLLVGAFWAAHPGAGVRPLLRRLAQDRDLDRKVTAWLLAGLIAAALYALSVAVLSLRFVANVERKPIGALILGGAAAALLVLFVFIAYPFQRVTRQIARAITPLGPVPGTAVLLLVAVGFGATVGVLFVVSRLDWRALPLGPPLVALGFVAAQLVWLGLLRRPIAHRLNRIGRRYALGIACVAAAVLPLITLSGAEPSERVVGLLTTESRGVKILVGGARRLFDRDGDGYSTLLGGGDCDDTRSDVHPGAKEIPGNQRDDNCVGGDSTAAPPADRDGNASPPGVPSSNATGSPSPPTAGPSFRWDGNILVLAVDTLRADRLGVAGYRRDGKSMSPRIDGLAERGVWFTRAWAQAPNTPRSFPSLFTSRYPSRIKWDEVFRNYSTVQAENTTLFEVFRGGGYRTLGFASHFYFTEERGITQGFDAFDNEGAKSIKDSNADVASPRIVPKVVAKLEELSKTKQKFVLFAHLFEPHSTYVEHEGFPRAPSGEAGLAHKYDYEILFVDRYVGEIVDALEKHGLANDTMIVLFSDHGEAFGQHKAYGERMFFHGQTLYDELLRVPVIFVVPGVTPRRVDDPIMLIDVAPTLVAASGLPIPPEFQGRSLIPALVGEALPATPVHAELLPAPSWKHEARMRIDADGKTKIIYRVSDNLYELYDLATDPEEKQDLYRSRKADAAKMKQSIAEWMDSL